MLKQIFVLALCASAALAQSEPASPMAPAKPDGAIWLGERAWIEGYAKVGFFWTEANVDDSLIGAHNGFRLMNARLGAGLVLSERLMAFVSVDGSVSKRRETDPLDGNRVVDLKDAYFQWAASRYAWLRAGQFKAPFNGETLLPDGALPFVTRSVVTDGVLPPEGFTRSGITLDRQVGLELGSERLGGDIGLRYSLAVVNGNGANVLNNDNNAVTPVARVTVDFGPRFELSANGFFNRMTEAERGYRLTSDQLGAGADLGYHAKNVDVFLMGVWRQIRHLGSGLPTESGLGLVGWGHYRFLERFEAGVRVAWYEPSNLVSADGQTEVAAMVGYRAKKVPLRFIAQYTVRAEELSAAVNNNSVDGLLQVTF